MQEVTDGTVRAGPSSAPDGDTAGTLQADPRTADARLSTAAIDERAAEIESWLANRLAGLVRADPDDIDVRQPFARYGLGSAQGLELAADLEDWLGHRLAPTLVWDYPTIQTLARYLAEDPEGAAAAADYVEDY
jgi:acyl carrier protein